MNGNSSLQLNNQSVVQANWRVLPTKAQSPDSFGIECLGERLHESTIWIDRAPSFVGRRCSIQLAGDYWAIASQSQCNDMGSGQLFFIDSNPEARTKFLDCLSAINKHSPFDKAIVLAMLNMLNSGVLTPMLEFIRGEKRSKNLLPEILSLICLAYVDHLVIEFAQGNLPISSHFTAKSVGQNKWSDCVASYTWYDFFTDAGAPLQLLLLMFKFRIS